LPQTSKRTSVFGESVIRRMTRVANAHGAINLSQGYPDFDPPEALLKAAMVAAREGDAPHTAIGAKAQFLHVRVLGAAQGIDCGPTKTEPKMLKQPDPSDQLDTHGFR